MRKYIFFGAALAFACSCAPARFVEPLAAKQWSVGGNFGGPVIEFGGAPIPVPLTAIEVGYGIDSTTTVFAGVHTTALLFGNGQLDFGVTRKFINQNGYIPNVSASLGGNLVFSPSERESKFWPVLDVNAYWNYGKRNNYFYVGVNNYFELSKTMALDQPQGHHVVFSPQIGHIFKATDNRYQFLAEIKFIAPNVSNATAFVPYKSLTGSHGATGFFLGFRKNIGVKKSKQ